MYPIARHYLSLSLPFADCPNEECGNHGRNVFEHYFDKGPEKRSLSRYNPTATAQRVICRSCRSTLYLGEPLRLTVNLLLKRSLKTILEQVMSESAPSITIKRLRKLKSKMTENAPDDSKKPKKAPRRPDAYYNQLRSIGNRLRDYHSWRNARLLDPDLKTDRETPVRVYTDVMKVSMVRYGDGPRHQFLDLIVSVLATAPSPYILAIHPTFIPEKKSIDVMDILARAKPMKVDYTDEWAGLQHPGQVDIGNVREALRDGQPDISRGGYFMHTIYAAAAHFLTVQKLLARFDKVYYYMDAAKDLHPAALSALIEPIRAGNVEIALFQYKKEKKKDKKSKSAESFRGYTREEKQARLTTAYRDMDVRFREQVRQAGQIEGAEEDEALLQGRPVQARDRRRQLPERRLGVVDVPARQQAVPQPAHPVADQDAAQDVRGARQGPAAECDPAARGHHHGIHASAGAWSGASGHPGAGESQLPGSLLQRGCPDQ